MNYKCKICGYRFKSNDEMICPECLTAREEDISCFGLSHEDHCHNSYEHYKKADTSSVSSDTFKEDNSFIDEIKREENNDIFANKVQQQADSVKGAVNNNQKFTGNNYQGRYNQNVGNNNFNPKKKKSGCSGCFIAMVVIFFILPITFSVVPDVINNIFSGINKSINDDNSKEKTFAHSEQCPYKGTEDENVVLYYGYSQDVSHTPYNELEDKEKKQIISVYKTSAKYNKLNVEVNIVPKDTDKDTSVVIYDIRCSAYDKENGEKLSYYSTYKNAQSKTGNPVYRILINEETTLVKLKVSASINNQIKEFDFEINLNDNE